MPVVRNKEVAVEKMYPLVERREYIGESMGAAGISMGEITIQPGGEIPLHRHSVEDCILLRQGAGEIHMDGEVVPVEAPMSILIPPGVPHKVMNTGSEPIRIIFGFPAVNPDRELL